LGRKSRLFPKENDGMGLGPFCHSSWNRSIALSYGAVARHEGQQHEQLAVRDKIVTSQNF
jgi:hypothetical protein